MDEELRLKAWRRRFWASAAAVSSVIALNTFAVRMAPHDHGNWSVMPILLSIIPLMWILDKLAFDKNPDLKGVEVGRRWKLWHTPGPSGCAICGSKENDLASPGFGGALTGLWCGPCLVVSGKVDASISDLRLMERLGWLENSRKAFRKRGMAVLY